MGGEGGRVVRVVKVVKVVRVMEVVFKMQTQMNRQTNRLTDTYLHSSRPRDRTLELCFLCTPEHSMHSKHP